MQIHFFCEFILWFSYLN